MLFFYSTLGAVMPYMPLYYRKIGISGKTALIRPFIPTYKLSHF